VSRSAEHVKKVRGRREQDVGNFEFVVPLVQGAGTKKAGNERGRRTSTGR